MTTKTITDYQNENTELMTRNGFTKSTLVEDLALITSEVSEALEDFRNGEDPSVTFYEESIPVEEALAMVLASRGILAGSQEALFVAGIAEEAGIKKVVKRHQTQDHMAAGENRVPMYKPCGIPSEIADVVIRCMHFAGKHGFSLEDAIAEKMAYNHTRSFRHGNKKL